MSYKTKQLQATAVLLLLVVSRSNCHKLPNDWHPQDLEPSPSVVVPTGTQYLTRHPKVVFGTTTTSTTTLSTTTACYTSAAAITTACSKKKRSIEDLPIIGISVTDNSMIVPSSANKKDRPKRQPQSLNPRDVKDLNQIAAVKTGSNPEKRIEGRYFYYWYTSTVTSTSTSFTATTTFTISNCTPAGNFVYNVCQG